MDAKKYYSLESKNDVADLYIFGDITSWPWLESDVSASGIVNELQSLDAKEINVHINSYGGEVAEGLAIYNTLKNSDMKVTTICDGFACSAASVIFMAGDERIINEASLLMIHNAWTYANGNATELRKAAEDLDKITQAFLRVRRSYKKAQSLVKQRKKIPVWLARKCMSYKGILDHTDSYNIKRRYNANKTIQICKGVISHESKIRHYTRECYCKAD